MTKRQATVIKSANNNAFCIITLSFAWDLNLIMHISFLNSDGNLAVSFA